CIELPPISRNAWGITLGEKSQLSIHMDSGPNVFVISNRSQGLTRHSDLIACSKNGFDSGFRLRGVSRVSNHDPVSVPKERQRFTELSFPTFLSGRIQIAHPALSFCLLQSINKPSMIACPIHEASITRRLGGRRLRVPVRSVCPGRIKGILSYGFATLLRLSPPPR